LTFYAQRPTVGFKCLTYAETKAPQSDDHVIEFARLKAHAITDGEAAMGISELHRQHRLLGKHQARDQYPLGARLLATSHKLQMLQNDRQDPGAVNILLPDDTEPVNDACPCPVKRQDVTI